MNRSISVAATIFCSFGLSLVTLDFMSAGHAAPVDLAIVEGVKDMAEPPPVELVPQVATVLPVLDGRLSDPCWENATWTRFMGADDDPQTATEFATVRSDVGLYVAIRCFEPDLAQLRTMCTQHDGLFEFFHPDDWVEVLVDPGNTGHDYYWFIANAAGVRTDLACFADPDRSWNGEWQAASGREEKAWTLEMFIPAATFNRASITDTWGFQVARVRISEGKPHAPEAPAGWGGGRTVWGGTYRRPRTWPKLNDMHFAQLPGVTNPLSVSPFTLREDGDPPHTRISAKITNQTGYDVTLAPLFRLQRPEAARGFIPDGTGPLLDAPVDPVTIAAGATIEVVGHAEALAGETIIAYLALYDERGDLLYCTADRGLTLQEKIGGAGPEFDLYTNEPEIRIRVDLQEWGPRYTLAYRLHTEEAFERRWDVAASSSHIETSVALADMPMGRLSLEMELRKPDGAVVARRHFELQRAVEAVGGEVKINRWRRCLWVDGKPYVAMGNSPLITHGLNYAKNMMQNLADQGFNTIQLWGGFLKKDDQGQPLPELDSETLLACLDAAQENGLRVILYLGQIVQNNPQSPFRKFSFSDDEFLKLISELVLRVRDHPALLGYESADEPEFFVAPEWLERVYRHIKDLDPYHIVAINNCRGARSTLNYMRASDLAGIDYYPIGKWPAATVGPLTSEVVDFAGHRPVRMWIQGYKVFNPRAPTPEELSMMTWSMMARGASALFYFIGRPDAELWDAQGRCAREIGALREAVTAEKRVRMAVQPEGSLLYADFRETPEAYWVIAVNEGDQEVVADLRLPVSISASTAEVQYEDRSVKIEHDLLRDSFAPFQRHVYRIEALPSNADPSPVAAPEEEVRP